MLAMIWLSVASTRTYFVCMALVGIQVLNKIGLSYTGAYVRLALESPSYEQNKTKFETKKRVSITVTEEQLDSSQFDSSQFDSNSFVKVDKSQFSLSSGSLSGDDEEDQASFGIVSIKQLRESLIE